MTKKRKFNFNKTKGNTMLKKKFFAAKKTAATCLMASLGGLVLTSPAMAAGLANATSAVTAIKTWAYGFLGVVVFVYLIYKVVMALMEKETWGDVLGGLGKVALAGGVIVAAEWAWAIFGS